MAFERTRYYGDRAIEAGKNPVSSALVPLKPIAWLFKLIIALFLILLITVPVYIVVIGATWKGTAQTFLEFIEFRIGNIPLIGPYSLKFAAFYSRFITTGGGSLLASNYGQYESVVDKNSVNQNLGIHINSFQPLKSNYVSGNQIILTGEIEANSLKDAIVTLKCDTRDSNDELVEVDAEPKTLTLEAEIPSITSISCSFPKDKITTTKDFEGKTISLRAIYDFRTEGYWDIWGMGKDEFKNYKIINKKNPLNEVNDPNIKDREKGIIKTVHTYGPMQLAVLSGSQPFTDQGPSSGQSYYTISIDMNRDFRWNGNFIKIENFYIKLANNFELNTNTLGNQGYNDALSKFHLISDDGREKRYILDISEVEKLNFLCEDLGITDILLQIYIRNSKIDECVRRLEQGFPSINTQIRVVNLEGPELKKYSGPKFEVEYKFATKKDAFITLSKRGSET